MKVKRNANILKDFPTEQLLEEITNRAGGKIELPLDDKEAARIANSVYEDYINYVGGVILGSPMNFKEYLNSIMERDKS